MTRVRNPRGMRGGSYFDPPELGGLVMYLNSRVGVSEGDVFRWHDARFNGVYAEQTQALRMPVSDDHPVLGKVVRTTLFTYAQIYGIDEPVCGQSLYVVGEYFRTNQPQNWIDFQTGRTGYGFYLDKMYSFDGTLRTGTDVVPAFGANRYTYIRGGGNVSFWYGDTIDSGSPRVSGADNALGGTASLFSAFSFSASSLEGSCAAMLLYNTTHTDADRERVWQWIDERWSV